MTVTVPSSPSFQVFPATGVFPATETALPELFYLDLLAHAVELEEQGRVGNTGGGDIDGFQREVRALTLDVPHEAEGQDAISVEPVSIIPASHEDMDVALDAAHGAKEQDPFMGYNSFTEQNAISIEPESIIPAPHEDMDRSEVIAEEQDAISVEPVNILPRRNPSRSPLTAVSKRVKNVGNTVLAPQNKRKRANDSNGIVDTGEPLSKRTRSALSRSTPMEVEVASRSSPENAHIAEPDHSKSELFDFNDPQYVQHKSVRKLTQEQLGRVEKTVMGKAADYPCLKDVPVMRILSFGIHDNFGNRTRISLYTVILSWAHSLTEKLADAAIDNIHTALRDLHPIFRKEAHGFNFSKNPAGPNQPGRFSLDNFELNDPLLKRPDRIAKLTSDKIEILKAHVLDKAKTLHNIKKLPPEVVWLMSVVSITENFGTKATIKDFVKGCFNKLSKVLTRSLDIPKTAEELYELRLSAKTIADPRRGLHK